MAKRKKTKRSRTAKKKLVVKQNLAKDVEQDLTALQALQRIESIAGLAPVPLDVHVKVKRDIALVCKTLKELETKKKRNKE